MVVSRISHGVTWIIFLNLFKRERAGVFSERRRSNCTCSPRTLLSNNGLNKLPWTSYLHAILSIISRGVSGLATDSPCGVWGRGLTICLLHDSPLFGSYFKLGVLGEISYISCLGSWFHV